MKFVQMLVICCVVSIGAFAQKNTIVRCQYWFNDDFDNAVALLQDSVVNLSFSAHIDASSQSEGLHALNMRFQDANGEWSPVKSQFFIKITPMTAQDNKVALCQYWVDADFTGAVSVETSAAKDIIFEPSLDFSETDEGLHALNMRFRDANGEWSPVKSQFFIKKAYRTEEAKVVSYQYWFDDNFSHSKTLSVDVTAKDVVITNNLDLRRVPKGVHYLNFRAMDNYGVWSSTVTDTLEKISLPIADFTVDTISVTCQYITLQFNDNSIDGDSIAWIFGDGSVVDTTRNPVHEFVEGDYTVSLTVIDTTLGKDSAKVLPLSLEKMRIYELFAETACDSFVWNKETYFVSGDYVQTFQTENGCDSIVKLHLTVNKHVETEIQEAFEQPFEWNGKSYDEPGVFKQTLTSQNGCDSVVVLYLMIATDVETESSAKFTVYPVPVENYMNVEYSGMMDYVEIVTSTGHFLNRISVADTHVECDLSSLPDGLYAIIIYPMDANRKPIRRTFLVHKK